MESFGDKTRAVLYALLVHLITFTLLFVGLMWAQVAKPISIPGAVIEATLVGPAFGAEAAGCKGQTRAAQAGAACAETARTPAAAGPAAAQRRPRA